MKSRLLFKNSNGVRNNFDLTIIIEIYTGYDRVLNGILTSRSFRRGGLRDGTFVSGFWNFSSVYFYYANNDDLFCFIELFHSLRESISALVDPSVRQTQLFAPPPPHQGPRTPTGV